MKILFLFISLFITTQVFSQEYIWEITDAKKKGGYIEVWFFYWPESGSPEEGPTGEFSLKLPREFVRDNIYSNMPDKTPRKAKSLKGLFFKKDPYTWNLHKRFDVERTEEYKKQKDSRW